MQKTTVVQIVDCAYSPTCGTSKKRRGGREVMVRFGGLKTATPVTAPVDHILKETMPVEDIRNIIFLLYYLVCSKFKRQRLQTVI